MNSKLIFFFLSVQILFCVGAQSQQKKIIKSKNADEIILSDRTTSTIQIFKERSNNGNTGWYYKSSETHYDVIFNMGNPFGKIFNDVPLALDKDEGDYYLSKFTTIIRKYQGSENDEKTIKVEITPLRKPYHKPLVIKKKCGGLALEDGYYKTVNYECCGGDDEYALYDFQNNLIIEGDVKVIIATIPNSKIKFFTGYKSNENDTSFMGTVFYSYNGTDKYQIRLNKTSVLPSSCGYRVPEVFISSSGGNDQVNQNKNEYTLWSLNKISNKKEINNISLEIAFECNEFSKNDTITIPIVNGMPFGKDNKIQYYTYTK